MTNPRPIAPSRDPDKAPVFIADGGSGIGAAPTRQISLRWIAATRDNPGVPARDARGRKFA